MSTLFQHVVYHGTPREFDAADLAESVTGGRFQDVEVPHDSIWFTDSWDDAAQHYACVPRQTTHSRVIRARVTLHNPFIFDVEDYANEGLYNLPESSTLKRQGFDGAVVNRGEWNYNATRMDLKPTHLMVFKRSSIVVIDVTYVICAREKTRAK